MKLKTKFQDEYFDFGKVKDVDMATMPDGRIKAQAIDKAGRYHTFFYNSLQKMCEEWEDAPEETKEDGLDNIIALVDAYSSNDSERYPKEIVGKLKAITRLKSCGFKFKGWRTADLGADKYYFVITAESDGADKSDLDLLFSGGEE